MSSEAKSLTTCFLVLSALSLGSGCGGDRFEAKVLASAEAGGAMSSEDTELVELVNAVENERGLPRQLAGDLGPDADNAAAALAMSFGDATRVQLTPVVNELIDERTPTARRAQFVSSQKMLIERTARSVDRPRCRFRVGHEYGFFGTMSYLEDATLAAGLLTLRGSESGRVGEPALALADLQRALRVAHWLSQVRRVEARVLAGTLRARALVHAEALFQGGELRRSEAETLYASLRDQLSDWPSDRRMLIGERAMVIHSYEAIRQGLFDRLVTLDERQRLEREGVLEAMKTASPTDIDADEAAYLRAMRRVLAAADTPHHARTEALEEAMKTARTGPLLFAVRLFLQDTADTLRLSAVDRARAEAWAIALSGAADLRPPPFRVSPVDGSEYVVTREGPRVQVSLGEENPAVVSLPTMDF